MKRIHGSWVEWAVVLGCVGFGLAIWFPVAGQARGWGKAEMCMANLHILGRAWYAYTEDNSFGALVGGSNYNFDIPYRWVEMPLFNPSDNPKYSPLPSGDDLTLTTRLNGIQAGKLYPYIQDTQVYHCPADRNWIQGTPPAQPYRSYSIGGLMNGEDYLSRSSTTGLITSYRTVNFPTGPKKLINAEKMSQVRRPAEKFVFLEEDALSHLQLENMGSFILMQNNNSDSWWDWPALFHPDRGMLGFADGHVQGRIWTDPRTINLIRTGNSIVLVQPDNPDLQWMIRGYLAGEL